MNDTLSKFNGIRVLAEDYVKAYHPDECLYFGLAWDTMASTPEASGMPEGPRWKWMDKFALAFHKSDDAPLPVAAVAVAMFAMANELQRKSFSVDDFLPMTRACAKAARMPKGDAENFAQYMAPRIQQYCAGFAATADEAMCANIIQDEAAEKSFIWVGDKDASGSAKQCLSKAEIDTNYRAHKNDYDLFLDNGLVFMKRGRLHEGLAMRGHTYEILLLLLIRRGKYQTDTDLYRRAWSTTDVPRPVPCARESGNDPSDGVRAYLKRIRGQLSGLPGFGITTVASEGGIALHGNFSFCVILPTQKSGKYLKPLS